MGVMMGTASVVVTLACALFAGGPGATWCRDYVRKIKDPVPRRTWLLGGAWQAGLALTASGTVIGWASVLGTPVDGLLAAPVAAVLCQAGSVDTVCHRLPNMLLAVAAVFSIGSSVVRMAVDNDLPAAWTWPAATALALIVTAALAAVGSGMGMGDVKLMGVAGLWLGSHGLLVPLWILMEGFLLAGPVALALMASRRISRKDPMAFGPYLVASILLNWALSI